MGKQVKTQEVRTDTQRLSSLRLVGTLSALVVILAALILSFDKPEDFAATTAEPILEIIEPSPLELTNPVTEQPIAVDVTPVFVTLDNEGQVTLSAADVESIRIQIVQNVRLRPFLSGLSVVKQAQTVEGYIAGFNTAMIQGDTQRSQLYLYGSLLTAAVSAGDYQAANAVGEYVRAFQDDLNYIGPQNVNATELTLAIVALDALGARNLAAEYVQEVFQAKREQQRSQLIEDLKLFGLEEAALPETLRQPILSNQNVAESAPLPQDKLVPENAPHTRELNPVSPPQSFEPSQPPVGQPPAMVPTAYVELPQGGLAVSPYNWVLTVQGIGRMTTGAHSNDHFFFEGYNTSELNILGRTFYYTEMTVRRQTPEWSKNFTIVLIAGEKPTDIPLGEEIRYETIQVLVENTVNSLN